MIPPRRQCSVVESTLGSKPNHRAFLVLARARCVLGKLFDLSGLHSTKQYDVYLRFLTAYKREFMWLRLVQSLPLSDPW